MLAGLTSQNSEGKNKIKKRRYLCRFFLNWFMTYHKMVFIKGRKHYLCPKAQWGIAIIKAISGLKTGWCCIVLTTLVLSSTMCTKLWSICAQYLGVQCFHSKYFTTWCTKLWCDCDVCFYALLEVRAQNYLALYNCAQLLEHNFWCTTFGA